MRTPKTHQVYDCVIVILVTFEFSTLQAEVKGWCCAAGDA